VPAIFVSEEAHCFGMESLSIEGERPTQQRQQRDPSFMTELFGAASPKNVDL
jgi:hypothetical protein